MLMIKSNSWAPPHEQVVFIRLKRAFYNKCVQVSYDSLVNLNWSTGKREVREKSLKMFSHEARQVVIYLDINSLCRCLCEETKTP